MKKLYFLDKLGWPVERIKGRPILNLLRLIIHTRRITTKWDRPPYKGFSNCNLNCDQCLRET